MKILKSVSSVENSQGKASQIVEGVKSWGSILVQME
ncbi:hypothetical protein FHR92_005255 [Fontibacillus solani]|uniref:Uncharacterized protein n=2 Tax=Fontibacillus TaxID=995014 RepID=A0A1G7HHS7_9BACL|nr:hypothetical protein [Fontibacillus solani]SDF00040.1 hypothetical protein SAMN04488542_104176 [Fontibacillus panacisegetis]